MQLGSSYPVEPVEALKAHLYRLEVACSSFETFNKSMLRFELFSFLDFVGQRCDCHRTAWIRCHPVGCLCHHISSWDEIIETSGPPLRSDINAEVSHADVFENKRFVILNCVSSSSDSLLAG